MTRWSHRLFVRRSMRECWDRTGDLSAIEINRIGVKDVVERVNAARRQLAL